MATFANQLHQELKQKFVIERLEKLGVRESQTGKSIYQLDYDSLKYELVLAEMKQIDIESDANKWFR